MCGQYPFHEQKQQEGKVKVKETDPTWSQNCLFPETLPWFGSSFMTWAWLSRWPSGKDCLLMQET